MSIGGSGVRCGILSSCSDHVDSQWDPGSFPQHQCCGSMTFWCGSGSEDPCLWLMDPDPAIFIIDLQDAKKNLLKNKFFCLLFFESTFTSFFKDKKSKKSQNSRNQGFSYCFCLMIEGSGSIPLTYGSGSGSRRPKNMWIRRIRIRIPNTAQHNFFSSLWQIVEEVRACFREHVFDRFDLEHWTLHGLSNRNKNISCWTMNYLIDNILHVFLSLSNFFVIRIWHYVIPMSTENWSFIN